MKTAKIEFEMTFENKFSDTQIENWLKYQLGDVFELNNEDDIDNEIVPDNLNITIIG